MTESTKVLVTGGAGFIGSHLVNGLLDNGYSVTVVDDLSSGQLRNLDHRATFYHAPVNDPRISQIVQREGPEIIFHLAAQSSVRQSTLDPVADADSNVLGTIRLLSVAAAEGVDKIVFSSTGGAIYGNPDTIPCDEDTPVNPLTPYALSKYVSELYLELFNRTYGLQYTILRYANVYGPGQDPNGEAGVIAIFAGMMLRGRSPSIYGDGLQERDFVYVSDVVEANLAAAYRGDGRTYNIGTGEPVTINRIHSLLQEFTEFRQEPVYRPRRAGEVLQIALDPGRAAKELGWEPRVSLEEGLRRSVDYVREASVRRSARARFGANR
ncbi:MAG: NAD-dependent epimerase/dehydratase family protein [Chloroflexota bacterium]|nr:NAD-dependent epimerase/dehydratase family protein [Chloroflexota bacterium]